MPEAASPIGWSTEHQTHKLDSGVAGAASVTPRADRGSLSRRRSQGNGVAVSARGAHSPAHMAFDASLGVFRRHWRSSIVGLGSVAAWPGGRGAGTPVIGEPMLSKWARLTLNSC
jgi:hypothetical protein